jgi:hypothetical protein
MTKHVYNKALAKTLLNDLDDYQGPISDLIEKLFRLGFIVGVDTVIRFDAGPNNVQVVIID